MSRHPRNHGRPPVETLDWSSEDRINDDDLEPKNRNLLGLIVTPDLLVDPSLLLKPIQNLASVTIEELMIFLFDPVWSIMLADYPATRWNLVQKFLGALYGAAVQTATECGRPDLVVSFFFEGSHRGPKQPIGYYRNPDPWGDDDIEAIKAHVEGTFYEDYEDPYTHPLRMLDYRTMDDVAHVDQGYRSLGKTAGSDITRYMLCCKRAFTPWFELQGYEGDHSWFPWDVKDSIQDWTRALPGMSREQVADLIPRDEGFDPKDQVEYNVVALGGTFDHLHAGHKLLLTMGIFLATKKLIIGVSSDDLLKNKAHADLIEPLETRIQNVREFVLNFNRYIDYEIVPINDVYGPTATDANIQALVLSTESAEGGEMVAKERERKGLSPLKIFSVDVVHSKSDSKDVHATDAATLKELKMGSSHIRAWIAAGGRRESDEEAEDHKKYLETMEKVKAAIRENERKKEAENDIKNAVNARGEEADKSEATADKDKGLKRGADGAGREEESKKGKVE